MSDDTQEAIDLATTCLRERHMYPVPQLARAVLVHTGVASALRELLDTAERERDEARALAALVTTYRAAEREETRLGVLCAAARDAALAAGELPRDEDDDDYTEGPLYEAFEAARAEYMTAMSVAGAALAALRGETPADEGADRADG